MIKKEFKTTLYQTTEPHKFIMTKYKMLEQHKLAQQDSKCT